MKKSDSIKFGDLTMPIGAIFIIIAVILLFVFFMRGQTSTSGGHPAPDTTSAISCYGQNIQYPFYSNNTASSMETEINAIIAENRISSISLKYKFYYDNAEDLYYANSRLHGDMNISFGQNGLGADAIGANYAIIDNYLKFSLMASSNEITRNTLKYFFLDKDNTSYSLNNLKQIYEAYGLKCTEKQ